MTTEAQATPPASSSTTTTTTTTAPAATAQTTAQAQTTPPAAGPTVAAVAADLRTGAPVHDQTGGLVGTIESADASGAVVATGTVRARLPLASFGRNNVGVVIAMTRTQLEAAAAAAHPS
jgi:hypothetical protein